MAVTINLKEATEVNFNDVYSGDWWDFELQFTDIDTGVPIDLTNVTAILWQVKKKKSDTDAIKTMTILVGGGLTISDAALGKVAIDTAGIVVTVTGQNDSVTYYHDIQFMLGTKPKTRAAGTMKIIADVSRP